MKLRYVVLMALSFAVGLSACTKTIEAPAETDEFPNGVWRIVSSVAADGTPDGNFIDAIFTVSDDTDVSLYLDLAPDGVYYDQVCYSPPFSGALNTSGVIAGALRDLPLTDGSTVNRIELNGSVESGELSAVLFVVGGDASVSTPDSDTAEASFEAVYVGSELSSEVLALGIDTQCDYGNFPVGTWKLFGVDALDGDVGDVYGQFNADGTLSTFTFNDAACIIPSDVTVPYTTTGFTLSSTEYEFTNIVQLDSEPETSMFPTFANAALMDDGVQNLESGIRMYLQTIAETAVLNSYPSCSSLNVMNTTVSVVAPDMLVEADEANDEFTAQFELYANGNALPTTTDDGAYTWNTAILRFDQVTDYAFIGQWFITVDSQKVVLAEATFEVLAGQLSIVVTSQSTNTGTTNGFPETSIRYNFDDDLDGIVNITEFRTGTSPTVFNASEEDS